MTMQTFPVLLLAAAGLGTASAAEPDTLCEPLRAFVASVEPGQTHELTFHTIWGSNFKNEPNDAIAARSCEHRGYAPAKPPCLVLMAHGAIEFSGVNVQRALVCLAPDTHFGRTVQMRTGTFTLRYGTEHRGSNVTIEHTPDLDMGGMVLRVQARGY